MIHREEKYQKEYESMATKISYSKKCFFKNTHNFFFFRIQVMDSVLTIQLAPSADLMEKASSRLEFDLSQYDKGIDFGDLDIS